MQIPIFVPNRQKAVAKRTQIFSVPATVIKLDTGDTCVHEVLGCACAGKFLGVTSSNR